MPILIRMTPIPVCDDLLPLAVPPPLARLFSEVAQLSKTYEEPGANNSAVPKTSSEAETVKRPPPGPIVAR
jgi:hypothetical protein